MTTSKTQNSMDVPSSELMNDSLLNSKIRQYPTVVTGMLTAAASFCKWYLYYICNSHGEIWSCSYNCERETNANPLGGMSIQHKNYDYCNTS